jgi:hydrogenase maturation protease
MKTPRILIVGAGDIRCGDDGFGVEVAMRLARQRWPAGVLVRDHGLWGLRLAYELLDSPELLIVIHAVACNRAPGTLVLIEPDQPPPESITRRAGPHDMSLPAVLATVLALGGTLPRLVVVGCQPERLEGPPGLSSAVRQAVEPAAALVQFLIEHELSADPHRTSTQELLEEPRAFPVPTGGA